MIKSNVLKLSDRLRSVQRWNGIPALDRSNVAEHSYRVMFYMRELIFQTTEAGYSLDPMLVAESYNYAVIHDIGEIFTCDVGHHIKRKYKIKSILDKIEDEETSQYVHVPEVSVNAKAICKLADIIDFSFEADKELTLGMRDHEYPKAIGRGLVILEGYRDTIEDEALKYMAELAISTVENLTSRWNDFISEVMVDERAG